MSCFIVSAETIDRIISTIELQGGWARHAMALPVACLFDWNALGRAMLDLNATAFNAACQENVRGPIEVPDHPLYRALAGYADALAVTLAESTPEYRSAA